MQSSDWRPTRRGLLAASGTMLGAVALARPGAAQAKKFKIALSNSYIGNKWRIEMENVFKAALQMEPFKSEIEGSVFNADNDVSKQSQQLSNIIAQRPDAIIINAASPTGLNGIINQGAGRGILMVAFDNTVTTDKCLKVNTDQYEMGRAWADFLVKKLNGQGNVIMVTGVAGTEVDQARNKGAEDVFGKAAGIKVVNRFTGMWDSSTAERNTASILPSLPQIDGIWCQGGTDGVIKAFISANRKIPPVAGEAENGFRRFMVGYNGTKVDGFSIGQPPYLSVVSLELARRILRKEYPNKDLSVPLAPLTSDQVKLGETAFADQPDSFFADFTDGGDNPILKLCVDAALNGTPCSG
ncbi:MAG: ABC transporter substrate-binding protein, partial [Acetobacteraceae bacterium]|nr:ABC transporter substrate-binding protein [Acetobacteraceae bacterium]